MAKNTDVAVQEQEEALAKLAKNATKTKQEQPRVGMLPFIKMGKDGMWEFGQSKTEVQEGSLWAINPFSYRFGYTCWTDYAADTKKKNVNLGHPMVALGVDPIDQNTLPQHIDPDTGETWPWTQVIEIELTCVKGEDKGVQTVYQTSSAGGLRVGSGYLDLLTENIALKVPVAVVELKSDHYNHAQWGKTYVPDLKYDKWLALNDTELGGAPVEAAKPAPQIEESEAKETPPETEPADAPAEAAQEAPAPTRRRRPAA